MTIVAEKVARIFFNAEALAIGAEQMAGDRSLVEGYGLQPVRLSRQQTRALAPEGKFVRALCCSLILLLLYPLLHAQKPAWRQATDAELASLLPARAPVEKEHIETEMRTASGIVDKRGHYIAGVVLITAGYSAEGKYSHYLVVQAPVKIGGIAFKPGEYLLGYVHTGDELNVHFNDAATGAEVGTTAAHRLAGSSRVEQLHIWPPSDKALIQIGRFGIPYELGKD